jgi:hypothetical protein
MMMMMMMMMMIFWVMAQCTDVGNKSDYSGSILIENEFTLQFLL